MSTSTMTTVTNKMLHLSKYATRQNCSAQLHSMARTTTLVIDKKHAEKIPLVAQRCMMSTNDNRGGKAGGISNRKIVKKVTTTRTSAPRRPRRNDAEGVYGKFVTRRGRDTPTNASLMMDQQDNDNSSNGGGSGGVPKFLIHHHLDEHQGIAIPTMSFSSVDNIGWFSRKRGAASVIVGGGKPNKPLPTLDASPLLDATRYIKRKSIVSSAGITTVSGTDGAKRLLRGRKTLEDIIKTQLLNRNYSKLSGNSRAFALSGHGVPQALLEDHLLFAEGILESSGYADECSFMNTLDWMLVRYGKDGVGGTAIPWPPRDSHKSGDDENDAALGLSTADAEHRLDLYLAVMNRIAAVFGAIIDPMVTKMESDIFKDTSNEENNSNNADDDNDFIVDRTGLITDLAKDTPLSFAHRNRYSSSRLKHWRVFFLKGERYSPDVIMPAVMEAAASYSSHKQNDANDKQSFCSPPIVELTQMQGAGGASAHVRVTLQGTPPSASLKSDYLSYGSLDHGKKKEKPPVTVMFDACFGDQE